MANQEAVDIARKIKDPQKAAKQLVAEALKRDSKDDISCIVVRFKGWKKIKLKKINKYLTLFKGIYISQDFPFWDGIPYPSISLKIS